MKTLLKDRIEHAARVIRDGRNPSRSFDSCFEWGDGDQVVAALVRRGRKNPRIAENLSRYVAQESIDKCKP